MRLVRMTTRRKLEVTV